MQFPDRETVACIRAEYPPGTRVELVKMDDLFAPPVGTIGTVVAVDDAGDLCMVWSTGSTLKVILGEDTAKKVEEDWRGGINMGAICELCGRDMLESKGCAISKIHIGGKVYKRIPVGGKGDFFEGASAETRCGDCGALVSHCHHWGCDCERCPACGLQLIDCDCEDVYAQGKK